MGKKLLFGTLIIFLISTFLIPIKIYISHVGNEIGSDPAKYGQLGDYVGGIINPIIGVVNVAVLLYLTYTVSHLDDKRHNSNLEAQRKITLSQMRFNTLERFVQEFDKIMELEDREKDYNMGSLRALALLKSFNQNSYFLFKTLFDNGFHKEIYSPLFNSLNEMHKSLEYSKVPTYTIPDPNLYLVFTRAKLNYIARVQNYIITEME